MGDSSELKVLTPEEKEKELAKDFADLDNIYPKEDDAGSVGSNGKQYKEKTASKSIYKDQAKKYPAETLSEEKIKEIVNKEYPLIAKDDEEVSKMDKETQDKTRKKRSDQRTKFKAALKTCMDLAHKTDLKEQIIVKEDVKSSKNEGTQTEPDKKTKTIKDILRFQSQLNNKENQFTEEEMKEVPLEELEKHLGVVANELVQQLGSSKEEIGFTFLTMVAQVAEGVSPYTRSNYDIDFNGVYQAHMEKKDQLKQVVGAYIADSPEIQKLLTPQNQLLIMLMGLYGGTAMKNKYSGKNGGSVLKN